MTKTEKRHLKAAIDVLFGGDLSGLEEDQLETLPDCAACIADTEAQIVAWFDAGCPGLDRERFVAFGPIGMVTAMRDAIARGDYYGQG